MKPSSCPWTAICRTMARKRPNMRTMIPVRMTATQLPLPLASSRMTKTAKREQTHIRMWRLSWGALGKAIKASIPPAKQLLRGMASYRNLDETMIDSDNPPLVEGVAEAD